MAYVLLFAGMFLSNDAEKDKSKKYKTTCSGVTATTEYVAPALLCGSMTLLFVIGYLVLGCVSYYWFRHKYSCQKKLFGTTMIFLVVFILQGLVITSFSIAWFIVTDPRTADTHEANVATLVFLLNNVIPIFRVSLPCLFILRENKNCFQEDKRPTNYSEYAQTTQVTSRMSESDDIIRVEDTEDLF